uniref:Hydrogenase accessory protein HypB n=1 Tax=Caldicellulosiruptor owensensis TaxID=55205 RepID=A0A7C5Z6K5_9FIRM
MDKYKIIKIKQSVFSDNDRQANVLREELKNKKVFLLNIMSSPGAGKTTTVLKTIEALKNDLRIGVIEADIDSDVDASLVAKTGAKVVQIQTGGMCHLTAAMTKQGLDELSIDNLDIVILENIGNLICPAEFDTGASKNAMILSVPEGDDKPLKYPLMFSVVDVLLINKIDALPLFDFNIEKVREYVQKINPRIKIIPISAKTGEGFDAWIDWIRNEVQKWRKN